MKIVVAGSADDIFPLIRERMEQEKISQRVLADHLGFSYKHMSQVITGKCGTPLPTIFRICEYLDIGIALMPGKGSRCVVSLTVFGSGCSPSSRLKILDAANVGRMSEAGDSVLIAGGSETACSIPPRENPPV